MIVTADQVRQALGAVRTKHDAFGAVVSIGDHSASLRDEIEHVSVCLSYPEGLFSGSASTIQIAADLAAAKRRAFVEQQQRAKAEGRDPPVFAPSPQDRMHREAAQ